MSKSEILDQMATIRTGAKFVSETRNTNGLTCKVGKKADFLD